ncbi:hypothetical protein SOVF_096370 isoform A [Spinacia oleracea]|nr:hypothetical protein SOVF_096370 isoform A [Spinacia oleracea]
MAGLFLKLCNHGSRLVVSITALLAAMIVLAQLSTLPFGRYISTLSSGDEALPLVVIRSSPPSWNSVRNGNFDMVEGVVVGQNVSKLAEELKETELTLDHGRSEHDVDFGKELFPMRNSRSVENGAKQLYVLNENSIRDNIENASNMDVSTNHSTIFDQITSEKMKPLGTTRSIVSASTNSSQTHKSKQVVELEGGSRNDSFVIERYVRKMRGATITFSEMKSMLLNGPSLTTSVRRKSSTTCDRQLLSASLQIKNAPVLRNLSDLHAPLYRNVSVFKRSYDLMERVLKIYVYKEGEKPIFHHPSLRGLYVAEGWFMKLMEGSKRFTVRDPKKAHLYYLPFSSETLRMTLYEKKSHSMKNLEQYLIDYVDLIRTRYRFWNRTGGADHFFVACHDWAPRITRHHMSSCIRGLCNANVARGFHVGKDVSVPVTYIRSGNDPTRYIGGKPPSERNILAFFAGQLHGYVRPLLLQYWGIRYQI